LAFKARVKTKKCSEVRDKLNNNKKRDFLRIKMSYHFVLGIKKCCSSSNDSILMLVARKWF
jgi:hypothetical protein